MRINANFTQIPCKEKELDVTILRIGCYSFARDIKTVPANVATTQMDVKNFLMDVNNNLLKDIETIASDHFSSTNSFWKK